MLWHNQYTALCHHHYRFLTFFWWSELDIFLCNSTFFNGTIRFFSWDLSVYPSASSCCTWGQSLLVQNIDLVNDIQDETQGSFIFFLFIKRCNGITPIGVPIWVCSSFMLCYLSIFFFLFREAWSSATCPYWKVDSALIETSCQIGFPRIGLPMALESLRLYDLNGSMMDLNVEY